MTRVGGNREPAARESETTNHLTLRVVLLLGLWFGLLGGLGEVGMLLVAKFGLHRYLHRSLDVVWQAPLSLALICALLAPPLALLARSGFGRRHPALPVGILGFVALLNVTPALGQLHPITRVVLVAGIASQATWLVARRLESLVRAARRSIVPLLAFVLALALGIRAYLRIEERRALAALPAASPDAPNVILLLLDTVRSMDLSLYGYPRRTTPELERLGSRGTVFDRAYATSSFTLPTHATIFTGYRPFQTSVGWHVPLDRTHRTLAEELASRGYHTGGFSANNYFVTRESGLGRGFAHFEDFRSTALSVLLGSAVATTLTAPGPRSKWLRSYQLPDRKSARHLRGDLLDWLGGVPAGRPYFAFINFYDAHEPYLPPAPFDTAFTGRRASWRDRNPLLAITRPLPPAVTAAERDAYDQAIAYLDQEIGALLADLERAGRLRNTIIVVTSDHGDEFGEHGLLSHGFSLNPSLLRVPLLVVFPGKVPAGARVTDPVSLVDLPATILALADSSRPGGLPGVNLFSRGSGGSSLPASPIIAELSHSRGHPDWFPVSHAPLRSLTLGGWHYLVDARGREWLMDISVDPAGRLVDSTAAGYPAAVAALRARLDSITPPGR